MWALLAAGPVYIIMVLKLEDISFLPVHDVMLASSAFSTASPSLSTTTGVPGLMNCKIEHDALSNLNANAVAAEPVVRNDYIYEELKENFIGNVV